MDFLFTLITSSPYIIPMNLIGWFGLALFTLVCAGLVYRLRRSNLLLTSGRHLKKKRWILFAFLLLITPISSLFFILRFSSMTVIPPLQIPEDTLGPVIAFFTALPWMLAAGFLGSLPAAIIAIPAGCFQAFWVTHNIYSIPETILLAVLFGSLVNQRYRTLIFKTLRHPIALSFLLALIYPFIYFLTACFSSQGLFINQLKYALATLPNAFLSRAIELIFAGIVTEIIANKFSNTWERRSPLIPSPAESSLRARFLFGLIPLVVILVLSLIIGDWVVAGRASQNLYRKTMENIAGLASSNIPYFLETGRELINSIAEDPRFSETSIETLDELLAEYYRLVPFFNQISILDKNKIFINGYPNNSSTNLVTSQDEDRGIQLALLGIQSQSYTVPPDIGMQTAQISFISPYKNFKNEIQGVLVGRTELSSNPILKPTIENLEKLSSEDGIGMLLDEKDRILYHPHLDSLLSNYSLTNKSSPSFTIETAPDGTSVLLYYQKVKGTNWSVVLSIPEYRAQSLALNIALPMLVIIGILAIIAFVYIDYTLHSITNSLRTLSTETELITQGKSTQSMNVSGEDEIGRLKHAFEQMRTSLQSRLEEMSRLLSTSEGVASNLDITQALQPILEAALSTGACSARIVLLPALLPEFGVTPASFGTGKLNDTFAYLDEQILSLTRKQDRLVLSNLTRPKILNFGANVQRPEAIFAISLLHDRANYGALWVAFDQPHSFNVDEVKFITTLSRYAAIATANSLRFMNSDNGYQQLMAILVSSPDPILAADQQENIILVNPAALEILDLNLENNEIQSIDQMVNHPEIVELLRSDVEEQQSVEIRLTNDRVYLAKACSIVIDGQPQGRICILRDITQYKKADILKSEFVYTVSHDLRTPLSQMRGFVTMFEMVGSLNEQQKSYLQKITTNLETMSHMVSNLLDFSRIEAGIKLNLIMVPIREIIDNVLLLLQPQALQKRIVINVEIPPETPPNIEGDLTLLQQAVFNLVENAIKFSRLDGTVNIRVSAKEDKVLFEVIDHGIGISPLDQQRLFEKFRRTVPFLTREPQSLGLGLAIVKSIVDLHSGKIWVESQLGKGSTFFVELPLTQNKEEEKKTSIRMLSF